MANTGSTRGCNNILYATNTKHLIGNNLSPNIIPIPLEHHKRCVHPTTTVILDVITTSPTNTHSNDANSHIPPITDNDNGTLVNTIQMAHLNDSNTTSMNKQIHNGTTCTPAIVKICMMFLVRKTNH